MLCGVLMGCGHVPRGVGLSRQCLPYHGHRSAESLIGAIFGTVPDRVRRKPGRTRARLLMGNDLPLPWGLQVKSLTARQVEEDVAWSDDIWAVSFGAPWCGPCQAFKPVFNRVAYRLQNRTDVRFGNVDCQQHGPKCHEVHRRERKAPKE
jgi:thiol-disulfide isomerase/thioredoxin